MSADLDLLRRPLPQLRLSPAASQTPRIDDSDEDRGCRTPTAAEHKIPAIFSCPPAPRKSARAAACKRKLSELKFFEIVAGDEVDSFFRSSFEIVAKRRCSCT